MLLKRPNNLLPSLIHDHPICKRLRRLSIPRPPPNKQMRRIQQRIRLRARPLSLCPRKSSQHPEVSVPKASKSQALTRGL